MQQFKKKLNKLFLVSLFFSLQNQANAWQEQEQPQSPPAQVQVTVIDEREIAPTMDVPGSIISLNDANISAQVNGALEWIADVGTSVNEGDVIARIDPSFYQINLRRSEAQLARLQADLEFREQEVKRFSTLASRDSASKARLQEELARRNMLLHDISDAKAVLDQAKEELSRTQIKAPFTGHLVNRIANKGEYLSTGDKIIRLVNTVDLEVSLHAPIKLLPYVKANDQVLVKGGELSQLLPIRTIVPVGDKVSRMVEIRLTVPQNTWVTGSPVTVSLPKEKAQRTLAVPRDAIIIKGSDTFIYRVNDQMVAEQLKAEIKAIDGLWVALKNEIMKGDKVVIRGGERLIPGQTVTILP